MTPNLKGMTLFNVNRTKKKGGGVALYVSSGLNCELLKKKGKKKII